ncbi:MAG: CorA family divalent cation transporter [Gaiellales bacterium]
MRAFLYDADGSDEPCDLAQVRVDELTAAQLLWVDIDPTRADESDAVLEAFGLDDQAMESLHAATQEASLVLHQDYFQLELVAMSSTGDGIQAVPFSCVAGSNWVLTSHREPLVFLDRFGNRFRGESNVGRLGSAIFVSTVLGDLLQTYDEQVRLIVNEIDRVDQLVFRDRIEETRMLHELVAINQRIVRLRRSLAPHRDVFERLTQADFTRLIVDDVEDGTFAPVAARLARTLASLDTARQMLATSLELYTTLVAHGTNKVIKLLTVVSVTLLPPTLLAGILGMNALPDALKTPTAFAISLAAMLALVATTLTLAHRRDWI